MKICSICNQTYTDDNLNYCLADGGSLTDWTDDAPPTVLLNQARTTQQNWENYQTASPQWGNQPLQQNQPFYPAVVQGQNQTLPNIALSLGICSIVFICCYGGFPFGLAAIIIGYIGLKNTNENPMRYGGRGLAIAGIVTGVVGLLVTVVIFLIAILAQI